MASCENGTFFTCETSTGRKKIRSLVVKEAVLPAVTICELGLENYIRDATIECDEEIPVDTPPEPPPEEDNDFTYTASGGLTLGGTAIKNLSVRFIATGNVTLAGSAIKTISENYISSGNITLSGSSVNSFGTNYIANGNLSFIGTAPFSVGSDFFYISSGGFTFGGSAGQTLEISISGSGGFSFASSSTNNVGIEIIATGSLTFGGAGTTTQQASFISSGSSLTFAGTNVNSIGISIAGSGGVEFSGGELVASNIVEIFDGVGTPPLPNYVQAGDAHVVKRGTQWQMFLSSLKLSDAKIYDHRATLTDGNPLATSGWSWNTASPVIAPSTSSDDWDYTSIETPTYVYGYDNTAQEWVERIYYTGWRTAALNPGNKGNYSIGMAQWSGSAWVKSASNPVLLLTDTPTYGRIGGDQGVVYDSVSNLWWMFYQEATDAGYTILKRANSKDGVTWRGLEQVEFGPPNAPVNLPNGPYHLDVQIIDGKWYFVGWLPKTPLYNQGIWATISYGPAQQRAGDFHYWVPLIYERQNGPPWFALVDTAKQAVHDIGLFSACLAKEGSNLFLFYLLTRWDTTYLSNVGSLGAATVSNDLLSYNLDTVSEYNTYTAYGYTYLSGAATTSMSLKHIASGGMTFSGAAVAS